MPCNLLPHAYEKLCEEDISWLEANSPASLEREHIIVIIRHSMAEYRARGYDEAMSHTGPHNKGPRISQ